MKKMVDTCQTCIMARSTNLRELAYYLLETTHRPRVLVYMDLIGPITGIKSKNRFILTVVDGYSRFLATRPTPNYQAQTVANAALNIFS